MRRPPTQEEVERLKRLQTEPTWSRDDAHWWLLMGDVLMWEVSSGTDALRSDGVSELTKDAKESSFVADEIDPCKRCGKTTVVDAETELCRDCHAKE